MQLLRATFEKDGSGEVKMIPHESEDMWHAYNLIAVGDRLTATAIRKVKSEGTTGSVEVQRVRTVLTVEVLSVDFDTEACVLRVKGRNMEENKFVKMGAHHTLELEFNRQFSLHKQEFDSVARDRVEMACDPTRTADVAAVVMEEGLAHVCLLTPNMTLTRSRIEVSVPRKRKGSCSQHDKSILRFYDQIIEAVLRHIKFDIVKCVIVASPGFLRDQFLEYMFAQAIRLEQRVLIDNKGKFLSAHASSGHKNAIKELLMDPAVAIKLSDTKAAAEAQALNDFYVMLRDTPDRAFYGAKHVTVANEHKAIDQLLVTDDLFRSSDLATRRRYVALVDSAKENGATVHVFSSLHASGEQLSQLTGIAAILRFPLPDLDQDDEDDDEEAGTVPKQAAKVSGDDDEEDEDD